MKWKLTLLITLVFGALAGSWIKNLPGFVVLVYDKTSYEMRLWVAVALLLVALGVALLLGNLIRLLLRSASRVKGWHGGRGSRRARRQSIEGMLAFTEGRWKASEDAMVKAAQDSDTQLINYLIAAQAAQQQNAEVRRDAYLRLAAQAEPDAKVAVGLTQAQLQLKHGQYEQALASLKALKQSHPNHPYMLKLLARLYQLLQDWDKLAKLLPGLKKQGILAEKEYLQLEKNCVCGLLLRHANQGDVEALRDSWNQLPAALRKEKIHMLCYSRHLIELELFDDAESLLKNLLRKDADAEVLALIGRLDTPQADKLFNYVENWQASNPHVPREVFLTLGKLAFYSQLWGKARHYLERALQLKPSAEAYLFMARTLEQLGDDDHAMDCYRQGLEFVAPQRKRFDLVSLPKGSEDLVKADLLPRFQNLQARD